MRISTKDFNLAQSIYYHGLLHLERCCNDRRPSVFDDDGFTNELFVIGLFLCRDHVKPAECYGIISTALSVICNGSLGKMARKLTELEPHNTIHTAEYLKSEIGIDGASSHNPTLTTFTAEDIKELWSQFEIHSF